MASSTRTVLGTCHHDCPDSCGWIVTVEDGVATKLRGNPAHPFSQGELCPKVNRFLDRVYSPDRVLTPLKRVGAKGDSRFEPISWEEALRTIVERTTVAIAEHGPQTVIPYSSAGNQSSLSLAFGDRFFTRLGATRLTGSVCGATARNAFASTYGSARSGDPMQVRHSKLVLLWGTNTKVTNRHLWPFIEEARANGARVVCIDPIRTATAEASDEFVQPLPGTDAALALGMMHVIIRDGLVDHDYVERHTVGFDELTIRAKEWTPERAAEVTGLDAALIERLATEYATTRPAMIRTIIGIEHHEHGAMLYRTLTCLPLLTGSWKDRGGGFTRSTGSWMGLGVDTDAVGTFAVADPSPRRGVNVNNLARALTDPELDPPLTVLFAWNGNPVVTQPNTELLRRGLRRDDLFMVVHEQFLTDTAAYADIVLPATTQIEQDDVVEAWGHLYVGRNGAAIAPRGEAVSNAELFRRLATAFGFTEPELHRTDAELLDEALAPMSAADRAHLEEHGFVRLPVPDDLRPYADGGFATASGKAELYSAALAAQGHDPLPTYEPATESPQGDAALAARFPLVLLTMKHHQRFLNSSYTHLPKHGPMEGAPFLEVHAADAVSRGLADGSTVRVWNDRGSLTLPVRLSDRVRPGVVAMPFGWWGRDGADGGVANSLTNDTLADWGGGVAYHDTLVQVAAV